jgi:cytochrome c-type biogenesis protein CcmE
VLVTPEFYRALSPGVDFSDLEDDVLAFHLTQATALVHAFCTVPIGHDFRGGSVVGENHRWRMGTDVIPGQNRIYPWHKPLLAVSSLKLHSTEDIFLEAQSSELFINKDAGWVEIAALNFTPALFGAMAWPILGLAVPVARVDYTYGWMLPVVNEELFATDGLLYRAQNQWWMDDPAPEIKVDGTVVTTGLTLDLDEGTVEFDDPQSAEASITASYTHKLPSELAQATAIVASSLLGERDLVAKGMNRLEAIRVEEVELRRTIPQRAGVIESSIPDSAKALLAGFVYYTLR